jgi:formylmethanofuran dehydrogenase subunit E
MHMDYQEIIAFHGHECPGLAVGYRMAKAAMDELAALRSSDEEIVAIVENDACGVDALQCVTGCTFGKGNLIFRDYGKNVYTLFSRTSGKGVRVLFHGKGIPEGMRESRQVMADWILKAPRKDILEATEVTVEEPARARIHQSVSCDFCGELVMETRVQNVEGKKACIPCAKRQGKGGQPVPPPYDP